MVIAQRASARERTSAAHAGDERLWRAGLAAGLVLSVAFVAVPPGHDLARDLVLYPLTELAAVAAIVVGVHRYKPAAPAAWLLIAAGFFSYWVGDVLWGVYEVQGRSPFPSPADAFYLAGYPLIAAGLVIAVLRRREAVDRRAVLDAALVAVSGALLAWVYVVQPAISDSTLSMRETLVTTAYPVGDWLLLAVAARFVTGSRWNVRSLKLLVLGLALTLAGDLFFELDVVNGLHNSLWVGDTLLLFGVVCIGLAGLHRSMTALTEADASAAEDRVVVRLVLLAVVGLVPPAVLAVQGARGAALSLPATITAMVVIAVLITLRSTVVTNEALQAADRESTLSRYADELLRADGSDALYSVAGRSATELVRPGKASLRATSGATPEAPDHGFAAPIDVRGETVAELVADADELKLRRAGDALATVAAQLALALERERLLDTERETALALSEQNERLRDLDRMKDQFVSSVSHELRTPLTSMIGYLEILLQGDVGGLTDEQRRFLQIVDRNSHRLDQLIEDILITARIDSGRFSIDATSVDLVELTEQQLESIRATAEQKHVELRLIVDDRPPPIAADAMRIGQLLDNLLSNAIKFTQPCGAVLVSITARDGRAHLQVSDTGVGIPADELDQLFERFFRASTSRTVKGTGLGLSIAR